MINNIKLLSVEDDPDDVYILQSMLEKDKHTVFNFTHVKTMHAASKALIGEKFDAALLDLGLPDSHGPESIRLLAQQFPELPIIVVTDHDSVELEEKLIDLGAEDFISKRDLTNGLLSRVIRLSIERKQLQLRIERSALIDDLTGLYNRQSFYQHLSAGIAQANRSEFKIAVFFIDLDKFKHINDEYGHRVGDQALKQFSDFIKLNSRESDIAARIGGDEFAIAIFNYESTEDLERYFDRLFSEQPIEISAQKNDKDFKFDLNFSTGICEWTPGDSVDKLIESADTDMYRTKRHKSE